MPDPGSITGLLAARAAASPDAPLVTSGGRTWTVGAADLASRRLAAALLDAGVAAGDRVAVMLPNSMEWVASWFAVLHVGAVLVPVNRAAQQQDLGHLLRDSGAAAAITTADRADGLVAARAGCPALRSVLVLDAPAPEGARSIHRWQQEAPVPRRLLDGRDDLASLQYTSGTTGEPKACMLTHGYWTCLGRQVRDLVPLTAADVVLTSQPFSYLDPQWNLIACLDAGARLVVLPRFSPREFWPAVREHGVTWFYVVGTMPLFLLDQDPAPADRDHQVRYVSCSGIVPDLHARMEDRWGVPWREAFGMTETGVDLAVPLGDTSSVGTGRLGNPIPTKRIRVVADGRDVAAGTGELWVSGQPMMSGYWGRPDETAAVLRPDGWLRTGDLVERDQAGHLRIVGRQKDMVRRAGENIAAAEVEAALSQHPGVLAVAVVPVADRLRGEEVKAFVLPAGTPPDPQELRDFLLSRLARFKAPRYIEWVSSFPMTPSERIAKASLVHGRTWDSTTGEWSLP